MCRRAASSPSFAAHFIQLQVPLLQEDFRGHVPYLWRFSPLSLIAEIVKKLANSAAFFTEWFVCQLGTKKVILVPNHANKLINSILFADH
jgi:hypothetical protein